MHARVIGEDGETHLLHVTCRKCQNSVLAVVLTNPSGVSSVGLITDLSFEDVHRFQKAPRVTIDDVIDAHDFVEGQAWEKWYQPSLPSPKRTPVKRVKRTSSSKSK